MMNESITISFSDHVFGQFQVDLMLVIVFHEEIAQQARYASGGKQSQYDDDRLKLTGSSPANFHFVRQRIQFQLLLVIMMVMGRVRVAGLLEESGRAAARCGAVIIAIIYFR